MLDPLSYTNSPLMAMVDPLAQRLSLNTLPLHLFEVFLAYTLYQFIYLSVSPLLSGYFFPKSYGQQSRTTKIKWDIHVVSLLQSLIICGLASWVILWDIERSRMDWEQRIWGYTGAGALVQAFSMGYFLWDLGISAYYVKMMGIGDLVHAVSALLVVTLGFRPFGNYYGMSFVLYELSTPFLNIHWFCDKLGLTGSRLQLYNGIVLILMFFGCRNVWGTYSSALIYHDLYAAYKAGRVQAPRNYHAKPFNIVATSDRVRNNPEQQIMAFAGWRTVPSWLAVTYLLSNTILWCLNLYWFGLMVQAVTKRFKPEDRERKEIEGSRRQGTGPVEKAKAA